MSSRYQFEIATDASAITRCQQLRYRVFALEMGASLESASEQIDADSYDPYCRHLTVTDQATGELTACTRVLADEDASLAGGFYTQSEFKLGQLRALPGRKLEVGRTCVHPGHRGGGAITCLWLGLAGFMLSRDYAYLFGCASVDMADGGRQAHAIYRNARERGLVKMDLGVHPRTPLPPVDQVPGPAEIELSDSARAILPPLLKAYLNLGANICGAPCWDRKFNVADMLVLVNRANIAPRYARRFLRTSTAETRQTRHQPADRRMV